MVTPNELRRYYSSIGRALNCSDKAKKHILASVKNDINEYLLENPNVSMMDLQNQFGSPETYAKEYVANLGESELLDRITTTKVKQKMLGCFIIAIIMLVLFFLIGITLYNSSHAGRYYSETVDEGTTAPISIIDEN